MILEILWLAQYNHDINYRIEEVEIMRYLEKYEKQQRPKQRKLVQQKQKRKRERKEMC